MFTCTCVQRTKDIDDWQLKHDTDGNRMHMLTLLTCIPTASDKIRHVSAGDLRIEGSSKSPRQSYR